MLMFLCIKNVTQCEHGGDKNTIYYSIFTTKQSAKVGNVKIQMSTNQCMQFKAKTTHLCTATYRSS